MRLGSSSISQNKTMSKTNYSKGLELNKFKKFNKNLSDNFQFLNRWTPLSGNWSTDGNTLSTPSSSSTYPIILNYDLRSSNISATMSLDSAGAGVAFWVEDQNNWWAAATFYTTGNETLTNGTSTTTTSCWYVGYFQVSGCTGGSCTPSNCPNVPSCCGCWPSGGVTCQSSTVCNSGTRTRYNFFVRILRNVNGTISQVGNALLLRSTCNLAFTGTTCANPCEVGLNDNINGIQLTTSQENITLRARNDANAFYATTLSLNASGANRGLRSGIIYTPGGNYLLSPNVSDISIVEN
jgi:hypothetical protein